MYINNFENSFDTWNLRNDVKFETLIGKEVYWIPFNSLGKTKYNNGQIRALANLPIKKQRACISNLYEAIQFFQNLEFEILSDKPYFTTPDGLKWQYQLSQEQSCQIRQGSCCEMASWLDYFISPLFDESGYILIQRPHNGHVMNYFRKDNSYYFVDIEAHHRRYKDTALKETGYRKDYYSTKFFTNALMKSSSIKSYISYYEKIISLAKLQFAFYRLPSGSIPPIACEINNLGKKVFLSKEYDFKILNSANGIETIYVDYNPLLYFKK